MNNFFKAIVLLGVFIMMFWITKSITDKTLEYFAPSFIGKEESLILKTGEGTTFYFKTNQTLCCANSKLTVSSLGECKIYYIDYDDQSFQYNIPAQGGTISFHVLGVKRGLDIKTKSQTTVNVLMEKDNITKDMCWNVYISPDQEVRSKYYNKDLMVFIVSIILTSLVCTFILKINFKLNE